jgi:hypothetical protein
MHLAGGAHQHLLGGDEVAAHLPFDDDGVGEHLALDLAIGADRHHVRWHLDLAAEAAVDDEVLLAVELAFTGERGADASGLAGGAGSSGTARGRGGGADRSGKIRGGRAWGDLGVVALPHVACLLCGSPKLWGARMRDNDPVHNPRTCAA